MTWICPECKAIFKNRNQWHSCVQLRPDRILSKSGQIVKDLYQELDQYLMKLDEVHRITLLSCISYKCPVTFLSLKPKKNHINLEISLAYKDDVFPISQIVQASKQKWVHFLSIDDHANIDGQLKKWMNDAYNHARR